MSETKFTPGPWFQMGSHLNDEVVYVATGDQKYIATIHNMRDGKDNPEKIIESEANAKLISAAPENTESNIYLTRLVLNCITVLQRHILPDGGLSDAAAMSQLYGLLDNQEIVNRLKLSEAAIKKATT